MADDENKKNGRDRSLAGEDHEVAYFAKEAGITPEQARTLIRRHGYDRAKLMDEVKFIKGD